MLAAYQKTLAEARAEAQATLRETTERLAAEAAERQRAAGRDAGASRSPRPSSASPPRKEQALAEIRGIAVEVGRAVVEKLIGAAARRRPGSRRRSTTPSTDGPPDARICSPTPNSGSWSPR